MDRISGLPTCILHDILSRLPEEDAVRTSLLSKAWRETWSTFPILSFCDSQIRTHKKKTFLDCLKKKTFLDCVKRGLLKFSNQDLGAWSTFPLSFGHSRIRRDKKKTFLDYVKRRLLKFSNQDLAIKELTLDFSCNSFRLEFADLDLCMKLATQSGVKVLKLFMSNGVDHQCYTLEPVVLESKSLNTLTLRGRINVGQSFLNCSIKYFSLRVLCLGGVLLGHEGDFENLISHCPMIEKLVLSECFVYKPPTIEDQSVSRLKTTELKSLSLHGLHKLKEVYIYDIPKVYIDAPNLEDLLFCTISPFMLNYDNCKNLRSLHLWFWMGTVFKNQWFHELFTKFPLLERLVFTCCSMSERINISSDQLKVLELLNCSNLKAVNIDAPNLLTCGYTCYATTFKMPAISFMRCSSQLELDVRIAMNFRELCKLRETIRNFKPKKVLASLSLSLCIRDLGPFDFKPNQGALQVSSHLPIIKDLCLMSVPNCDHWYVVNMLLSTCCPENISFNLSCCSKAFIKVLYESLIGRSWKYCYCSLGHAKCWWHGLKDVKVISSNKSDAILDFSTKLDAFATSGTFRLALL